MRICWCGVVTLLLSCMSPPVSAGLLIDLNAAAGMDAQAISGFQAAANYWQSVLTDDVTVNLDIDFTTLGTNILGSASSFTQSQEVDTYFAALQSDMSSADDTAAVAGLPTLGGTNNDYVQFRTQVNTEGGSTVVSLDSDGSIASGGTNNRVLALNTANAKALGLFAGSAGAADARITFSDAYSWDFDNSDGIGAGLQDFVGVAIHEIGHALGFRSGVDSVNSAITSNTDLDFGFRVFTGLDMFRYSANDGILDLSVGTASYFSLDGGATNLGFFSTGTTDPQDNGGDGRQASHWKDNLGLGIMDPTANGAGQLNTVSELDLRAFDVIGWDLASASVPEPSSFVLLGVGAIGLICFQRRLKPSRI